MAPIDGSYSSSSSPPPPLPRPPPATADSDSDSDRINTPAVSHSHAMRELMEMFPLIPKDIIVMELNNNNRELERTVASLLRLSEEQERATAAAASTSTHAQPINSSVFSSSSTDRANLLERRAGDGWLYDDGTSNEMSMEEADARLARRLQAELDYASAASLHPPPRRLDAPLSASDLARLKAAQRHHRSAIYRSNVEEGPFAPKAGSNAARALKESMAPAKTGRRRSDRQSQRRGSGGGERRPPLHHQVPNRVASAEEIAAGVKGPAALRALQVERQRLAERERQSAEAIAHLERFGYVVQRAGEPVAERANCSGATCTAATMPDSNASAVAAALARSHESAAAATATSASVAASSDVAFASSASSGSVGASQPGWKQLQ